jgi:ornithine cyclodeaminase/alanine dehydrogenase-like protein (mu-crystallin family)
MAHIKTSTTAVLTAADISHIIRAVGLDRFMDDVIARIREAALELDPETTLTIERGGFQYEKPTLGLVEWMPSMELGRAVGIKTVGYHPSNPAQRHLPSVMATTSIHDTSTGGLVALVEATLLTAIRTGAASAVVSDILADADASVLGLVGCGAQAVTQAHALSRIRPISRIVAFDADPSVAETLADRLPNGVAIDLVDTAAEAIVDADVVCTATTVEIGAGPVADFACFKRGLHVNAVGADFPGKTELPVEFLRAALVVPDEVAQCLKEGESQQLREAELGPTLAELVQNAETFAEWRAELTVFDSTGWALEDLIVAEIALDYALELNIGFHTQLQHAPADPYSPYESL